MAGCRINGLFKRLREALGNRRAQHLHLKRAAAWVELNNKIEHLLASRSAPEPGDLRRGSSLSTPQVVDLRPERGFGYHFAADAAYAREHTMGDLVGDVAPIVG